MPGPKAREALYRDRWRTAVVIAALVGVHGVLDLRYPTARLAVAVRAGWVALLVGAYLLQRGGGALRRGAAIHGAVIGSGLLCAWNVSLVGGATGPRFGILLALPLTALVLLPDVQGAALILGLMSCGAGAAVLVAEGREGWWIAEWVSLHATIGAVVGYGGLQLRRMQAAKRRAVEDRADALARLVESERRREQMERLAVAGRIATRVAHEINNPLAVVKANVGLLQARRSPRGSDPGDEQEILLDVHQAVDRLARIVASMRPLARVAAPEALEACDAVAVVREAIASARAKLDGVRLDERLAAALPPVLADSGALVQALGHLLVNAAQAVEPVAAERRWVRITTAGAGARVHISVEDGGPGLAPDAERHLFEPFFSTKGVRGTGLGLAVTRAHVHRCGGTIEGGNAPHGGALFTISLPAAGEAPPARPSRTDPEA